MFEKAIRISNCGFTIEVRKKVVDRDIAYEALTPKRQRKSTFAVREDNFVTITKHVVVCSFCGKETPAYEEYIRKSESNYQIKPQRLIETWLSRQMSIFGEQPKILTFNTPIKSLDRVICPRCKTVLRRRNEFVDISFKVNRKSIKVSRKLQFNELFLVKWMTGEICVSNFDIYEAITFNLRNGHTFVSLEDELGDKLRVRDVSNRKVDGYLDDPIFEVLNLCKPVYRDYFVYF